MCKSAKDPLCTCCDHNKVCSLKGEFVAAQKAVNNVCVGLGNCAVKDLKDFDWIKPVELQCIHYSYRKDV